PGPPVAWVPRDGKHVDMVTFQQVRVQSGNLPSQAGESGIQQAQQVQHNLVFIQSQGPASSGPRFAQVDPVVPLVTPAPTLTGAAEPTSLAGASQDIIEFTPIRAVPYDIDLDGLPDFLVVWEGKKSTGSSLRSSSTSFVTQVYLQENLAQLQPEEDEGQGSGPAQPQTPPSPPSGTSTLATRSFRVTSDLIESVNEPYLADINLDGAMDLVYIHKTKGNVVRFFQLGGGFSTNNYSGRGGEHPTTSATSSALLFYPGGGNEHELHKVLPFPGNYQGASSRAGHQETTSLGDSSGQATLRAEGQQAASAVADSSASFILSKQHGASTVDVDGDCIPELVLVTQDVRPDSPEIGQLRVLMFSTYDP
ncbi:unnamed protein product, partial [Amoebophrya sp. A25]